MTELRRLESLRQERGSNRLRGATVFYMTDNLVSYYIVNQGCSRVASLHELVMNEWQSQLEYLEHVHRVMGSPQPLEDARITYSLFRQLEQAAVLENRRRLDVDRIRRTLQRHMQLCFGVEVPLKAS